ncbi:MAG: STAS domain-containing protein [Acidobacteria bacterium]|nr:STAS domain-containing protein [Acidobacteriota bacterium]MCA1639211.1 STAS domain-containing protein [Acidobacteriota bacterium]
MVEFKISERQANSVTILDLSGDVIFSQGNVVLRNAIRCLLSERKRNILLNFSDVRFVDSSGIGELVSGLTAINKEEGQLKLLNLTQRIKHLLVITKLSTIFETFENERDALDSFN